jgi:hypothetical protein
VVWTADGRPKRLPGAVYHATRFMTSVRQGVNPDKFLSNNRYSFAFYVAEDWLAAKSEVFGHLENKKEILTYDIAELYFNIPEDKIYDITVPNTPQELRSRTDNKAVFRNVQANTPDVFRPAKHHKADAIQAGKWAIRYLSFHTNQDEQDSKELRLHGNYFAYAVFGTCSDRIVRECQAGASRGAWARTRQCVDCVRSIEGMFPKDRIVDWTPTLKQQLASNGFRHNGNGKVKDKATTVLGWEYFQAYNGGVTRSGRQWSDAEK